MRGRSDSVVLDLARKIFWSDVENLALTLPENLSLGVGSLFFIAGKCSFDVVALDIPECFCLRSPKGGRGCLMSPHLSGISGLSFDPTLLSPLLFFCRVLLLFLLYLFSCLLAHSPEFFSEKISNISTLRAWLSSPPSSSSFFVRLLFSTRDKVVGDKCSMLPYGTDICCYAFIHFFFILLSIPPPFFSIYTLKIWYWEIDGRVHDTSMS